MTMIIKIILEMIPDHNTVLTTISAGSPETEVAKHKKHSLALGTKSVVDQSQKIGKHNLVSICSLFDQTSR